jgi:nucleotide-binding universal stress UspA family protein
MITLRRILVATDFSHASGIALSYGRALSRGFDAHLHVVTVADNFFRIVGVEGYFTDAGGHQRDAEGIARDLLAAAVGNRHAERVPTTASVLSASTPAVAIVSYAREHDIDLIVLGSHGHGGFAHRIKGGVAEEVIRLAPCPVLAVKAGEHDFITPDAEESAAPRTSRQR